MRHRKAGLKLGRTTSHRDAMFKNMVTALFKHDQIRTTDVKAKELRRLADKLITLAKRGDLHARRQALSIIREKDVAHKLFETANARFGTIEGGYTRILKIGIRPGDATLMSVVSLYDADARRAEGKTKTKKKATSVKKEAAPKKTTTKKAAAATEKAAVPVDEQEQIAEEKVEETQEEVKAAPAEETTEASTEEPVADEEAAKTNEE